MKKRYFLFLFFLLGMSQNLLAQDCPTSSTLLLYTQEHVDNFIIDYPDCSEIDGNILINNNSSITNLFGLSNITSVSGTLTINGANTLSNLTGLENVTFVGGNLSITHNDILSDISALSNLSQINGEMIFQGNDGLIDLQGLENIDSIVGGQVKIYENASLISLDGLNNLSFVGDDFIVVNNDNLTSLTNLENLTTIIGNFELKFNDTLLNVQGINNLSSIGGNFHIWTNELLNSMEGVGSLQTVGEEFRLIQNDSLTSLVGLYSLDSVGHLNIGLSKFNNLAGLENVSSLGALTLVNNSDILLSLEGLDNLTYLGDLSINGCNALNDMSGLESLTSIAGDVEIWLNYGLTSLAGFDNITSVNGDFEIRQNDVLTSLSGLNNLTTVNGEFEILYCDLLPNLSGLQALTSVNFFEINGNEQLSSLAALGSLTTIEESIYISSNDRLKDLTGLNNLNYVGERTAIINNDSLLNISAINNLDHVGLLFIYGNNSLQSLDGIDDITYQAIDSIDIRENEKLRVCSADGICNYLGLGGGANIENNFPGCNDAEQVLDYCEYLNKLYYHIFFDVDENGVKDQEEPYLSTASVLVDPISFTAYGNPINGGLIYLPFDIYTVTYNQAITPLWGLTTDSLSYIVDLSVDGTTDSVHFGLHPTEDISSVYTTMTYGLPRCNEYVVFDVIADNKGTTITNGTMWVQVDENVLDIIFLDPPDTTILPNLYGWHFEDLFPGNTLHKKLSCLLPGPPDFPLGGFLNFTTNTSFNDVNGNHLSNQTLFKVPVECSYDPNDKLVYPVYPDNYALMDEDLIYTIRFQNTGNAEAYDVVIRDTLDPNLDPLTFNVITSSHEDILSTTLESNQFLTFDFHNIFLPDSTTDFDGSQGYIMYSIKVLEGIPEETIINNTAGIYFDFNPPVITNTTENIMLSTFDFDMDGFDFFTDCDDNNDAVNPGLPEVPYNGLNDDCDELTLDDDLDQDGFLMIDDCDDMNAAINPDAIEIPGNGIDEDCDGEDTVVSNNKLEKPKYNIRPNPTEGVFEIMLNTFSTADIEISNNSGKVIVQDKVEGKKEIDISRYPSGIYFIRIQSEKTVWIEKLVKL